MKRKSLLALMGLILGLSGQQALAQSTMMNAPSSDVVAAKKVFLEMDFITNYAWAQGDDRFANYLPRAVIGVGGNVEVGVNFSYTHTPVGGEPIEIQPNAKWQFYNNEGKGIAAAAGCMFTCRSLTALAPIHLPSAIQLPANSSQEITGLSLPAAVTG